MVVFPVYGIFFHILKKIVHPAHIPLEGESEAVPVHASGDAFPFRRFLGEREHASVRSLKDGIHMLEKFHRFDVFPSAILVGEPFPILSAIVKIEHARHGVNPYAVDVVLLYPEKSVGDKEVAYFLPAIVEYIGSPFLMFALSPVLVLIKSRSVESGQTV